MSIRFIIGRSGTGKTTQCLDEMKSKLEESPLGSPIVYLVPDQMTFQSEYKLIQEETVKGMLRAQVFSFTRLAWRVLQETGGLSRYHIEQAGVHMLLRKIVEHEKEQFKVYAKAAETTGFIEQLEEMVAEWKRYAITPERLEAERAQLLTQDLLKPHEKVLADKLNDFYIISKQFEEQLSGKYVDSEDYLTLLAEKIPYSSYIEESEVYVDGFHSFTPQELLVVEALMKKAKKVTIALTIDEPYNDKLPNELELFSMTAKTYQQLSRMATEQGCLIEEPLLLSEPVRYKNSAIAHLEEHYDSRPALKYEGMDTIFQFTSVNRRAEVEGVAREILHLVREHGYRYRDIALLIRNSQDYSDLIETIFKDYQIPVFLDQKRSMLNHPVIEFIRSLLDIIQSNWRYEAVFRCLKTDLLFSGNVNKHKRREEVDELENYVLAYGIQGHRWYGKQEWTYRRFQAVEANESVQTDEEMRMQEKLNSLRTEIVKPIRKLEKKLIKKANVQELCQALYLFLEELNVPKKVERLRDEAIAFGELDKAREHDQVWGAIIELLDQIVEVTGDEVVSFDLFRKMLDTGMESMKFALVPPAIDQVLVASMDRSRFSDIKCTFLLGVNDGIIPAKPKEEGVLSEEERDFLAKHGMELAPGSRQQLLDESFLIYLALTSASDRLYVSYPLADEEGKTLLPSGVIKRIQDLIPTVSEQFIINEPNEVSEANQLLYVTNSTKTLSFLSYQLQAWKKGYPVSTIWWEVYNWYVKNEESQTKARTVLSSLFYQNKAKRLKKETSKALYGDHIQASISRMEKYESCSFSQFASYGLKLKDRETYRLEAPDVGQLFHAALKLVADHLREQGIHWGSLTTEQCEKLATTMVGKLAPKIQREILLSSNRYQYITRKLEQVVGRASLIMRDHAKVSGFSPVGLEVGFGPKEPLPPIRFLLSNGCTMELIGRIDRVDRADVEKGTLLRIIDYKSSAKALRLDEVYYGLSLQMLVYLDVVLTYAKEWIGTEAFPAGVLYFHVHNPIIQAAGALSLDKIEDEIFKSFKMRGLLLSDETAIREMDHSLESGHSNIVPAGLKKDGSFYSNSSVISPEDFDHVRHYLRKKMVTIGEKLTDGEIEINPYKFKKQTPCTFCSFKSVCQFDASLETNEYRMLQPEKPDEIIAKIREERGE
ncbi:helicase-exonuclease AddAB subunit AddB [Bacillus alkalicellulosilyticus]|uniref:helicase-exonuclease AddAB subunit AddB n=1 Tax=Alkalihalobacterium alkalicellulosilyticum TaxID=1912214 RepID=UPI0009969F05|nr:helicase-exonuclease AddAB subunit AddB [Bacillus alkalicellulosilyticus]